MERRRILALMVAIVVAVIAAPILLLLLQGTRTPATSTTSTPPTHRPATPSHAASQRPDAEPEGVAWWRSRPDPADGSPVIEIGTLGGGATVTLELRIRDVPPVADGPVARPYPRVVGPVDGVVILVEEDGAESVLSAVTAATGEVRELHRTPELIIGAAFAGDGVVFLTVDGLDGTPLGLWKTAVDGEAPAERIPGVVGARPEFRTVAVVEWITELLVSADRNVVAVHRCAQLNCELRGLDLTTGEPWRVPLEFGSGPVGIVGGFVVLDPACVDVDCRIELLDLASGLRRQAPGSAEREPFEVAIAADPRPTVITRRQGPVVAPGAGPVTLELLDLETMRFEPLSIELGSLAFVGRFGVDAGIELPSGSILVVGSPPAAGRQNITMGYYVVDLASGAATPVPELGEVFFQG